MTAINAMIAMIAMTAILIAFPMNAMTNDDDSNDDDDDSTQDFMARVGAHSCPMMVLVGREICFEILKKIRSAEILCFLIAQ